MAKNLYMTSLFLRLAESDDWFAEAGRIGCRGPRCFSAAGGGFGKDSGIGKSTQPPSPCFTVNST